MSHADKPVRFEVNTGPVTEWPRPIPARIRPVQHDELFIMTLGQVRTPLADGVFDPVADRLTLNDGTVIENYYKEALNVPFFEPLDKSAFPLPPSGWCSWYYYYQEVSADEIVANARWLAENLKEFGARYVQIDDGWQGHGHGGGENRDWTTTDERFREWGMDGLAAEIQRLGLEAGIWLCPHGQSSEPIARQPKAFLLKPDGTSASDTWEGKYLVDPTTPEGHAYLRDLFQMLCNWGYTYFKIDGQPIVIDEYATAQEFMGGGRFSKDESADVLYRHTLRTIRAAIGPKRYLLGCWGVPLPGVGIMNGSRTGGDVGQGWRGLLVANDAIQRWSFLHNIAWYCDPDVCLVRPPLSVGTARAWATIQGLSGQALLTSDRLPDLPPARVELLKRIYPAVDIRPLDLFAPDDIRKPTWVLKVAHDLETPRTYDVIGVINFDTEKVQTFHLPWSRLGLDPDRHYHVYDFWAQTYCGAWEQGIFLDVPPADARVLTLVPAGQRPVLVGTSRHITQGWVDLAELAAGGTDDAPTLRGRSHVIEGDPYTLTIGLPRGKHSYRIREATARGEKHRKLATSVGSHFGCATMAFASDVTQDVNWEIAFEPTAQYVFPVGTPRDIAVTPKALAGALVSWGIEYYPNAGYQVSLDGEVLGIALQTSAVLRDLEPGRSYMVKVVPVWWDGSVGEYPAEQEYTPVAPDVLYLSELDPQSVSQGWGKFHRDRSVAGNRLSVGGVGAEQGLGTHADSKIVYRVYGQYQRFAARVGIDDEVDPPSPVEVVFEVWGDGLKLWDSGAVRSAEKPVGVSVEITGADLLELRVQSGKDGINYDHADWLDARVIRERPASDD